MSQRQMTVNDLSTVPQSKTLIHPEDLWMAKSLAQRTQQSFADIGVYIHQYYAVLL